jgi:hypothetical protein
LLTLAVAMIATSPAEAQPGLAHLAKDFQSNGAVTIKSQAGGTYSGTQNGTGAIAKANLLAVTQPPSVHTSHRFQYADHDDDSIGIHWQSRFASWS